MVDARRLLADLKRLRKRLDDDLRRHHTASPGRASVEAEWREARDTGRTADTFDPFLGAALDQASVHWILALVFLRFLEDNGLLDRPIVSGEGERLELAQARQREHFRAHPTDSDAEYLLATLGEVARLPSLAGLYDAAHNPLFRLPVSGDGARELFAFFRARDPATGALVHDFRDPTWNTRFLGDLYQDLSEEARKRFALLQTPEFIEDWILSRTLDPAIREFGIEKVRMIDPACGSGHFLLGGFSRLVEAWRQAEPGLAPAELAQRALNALAGVGSDRGAAVDINPFAVEIARFRLLLAAMKVAEVKNLREVPDFRISLLAGDSLLQTPQARDQLDFIGEDPAGFRRVLQHAFVHEDRTALTAVFSRRYHVVVGNPPYITPKDPALRDAYRRLYRSCHMKYSLVAPFIERFFDLALRGTPVLDAGYVGMIVANSFMKREFGKKLIEEVLPRLDLTHVVDTSGAYIPGHGTPTVILFGRNRAPVASVVRTVRAVRGEPAAPEDPARGLVWSAILAQTDLNRSESAFISTEDTSRATLSAHPWNMGGGGAVEVQEAIEDRASSVLGHIVAEIGFGAVTREDEAYLMPASAATRQGVSADFVRQMVEGEDVRDYRLDASSHAIWPYDTLTLVATPTPAVTQLLWPLQIRLRDRVAYGQTQIQRGLNWYEYSMFFRNRFRDPLTITFAFVATHNHFVLDRGGKVFNRTAPVIKLPMGASEDDHLGLLGLLNSSTACFWLQQICHNKGAGGGTRVASGHSPLGDENYESHFEHDGGKVGRFPVAAGRPLDLARALDIEAQRLSANLPVALCARAVPTRDALDAASTEADVARQNMIALQEELDWRCYRLYSLHEAPPEHSDPPPLRLGERAFEIVMARRMAAGELETAWFTRHRSTPITDLPDHWPDDYRAMVDRRIELIEADPTIGLIERPEYKRRWSTAPWEEMERDALRIWLLDRLEDRRFWPTDDPRIVSTRSLADATRRDADFQSVAELYAGRQNFDLDALVADLVAGESVPFLAALRYSETGLRKRADWEATWDKQRAEDAIDADLAAGPGAPAAIAAEAKRRKAAEVGDIPVPPKYRTPDFQSAVFWRLRGGLDVPKERFASFPHCARDADPSLPILWAGHDHLARAQALAALYVERKETDGWPPGRLAPLLAGLLELVPWLRQWHNDIDAETGLRMGNYFQFYVEEQARELGLTLDALRAWTPPAGVRRTRGRRATA